MMIYNAKIQNGVAVFEGDERPEEGAEVNVEPVPSKSKETIDQKLLNLAGKAQGCPADSSLNMDRYLYGLPKK